MAATEQYCFPNKMCSFNDKYNYGVYARKNNQIAYVYTLAIHFI